MALAASASSPASSLRLPLVRQGGLQVPRDVQIPVTLTEYRHILHALCLIFLPIANTQEPQARVLTTTNQQEEHATEDEDANTVFAFTCWPLRLLSRNGPRSEIGILAADICLRWLLLA